MILGVCVILADSIVGDRGVSARVEAQREYVRAEQRLEDLRNENAGLRHEARRLESDPAAIEAIAREELGLIKRGEILVVLTSTRPR
jgi:cell division protein FtsB